MATDTEALSRDVPSTSAGRAEADDALAASKRMHFTYARHYVPPSSPTQTDQAPSLASLGLTPLIDPRAVPDVLRAVLLEDGCVKVNFRDNTVLRLDATGSAFTVTTPEGETLRQLSEFAVTRFARKLRSALEFRNAHADVPFLPPAIAKLGVDDDGGGAADRSKNTKTDRRFRTSARARYASWSLDAEDAERSGFLTRLEGGGAALESTDGIARVVLSAHGLVARVTYPLLFAVKDLASVSTDMKSNAGEAEDGDTPPELRLAHDYVWHTQTFCADACPARWRFPVALLTRAVYGEEGSAGDGKENAEETNQGSKTDDSTKRERAGSVTTLPVSATALPRGVGLSHGLWVDEGDEDEKPWWSSPAVVGYPDARGDRGGGGEDGAKKTSRRPTVERAPGQTSFAVRSGSARSVTPIGTGERPTGPWVEVVSVLDADGDVLVSADAAKFVVHIPDEPKGAAAAKMYAIDAVPARVAPAGRAGVAFQVAQPGGEFEASQGRAKGGDRGGGPDAGGANDGVGPRSRRVPLGRFAARAAALRAAAAAPAADAETPETLFRDAVRREHADAGDSFGRGPAADADAAAWARDPDPWSARSAEVVEESTDEGSLAVFTAYADGRVRVKFADRTLLELRRDRRAARLLLPDGERVEVRAAAPMRWGAYVTAAIEFGRWAFLTPEARERAAEADRARETRVRAELDGIRRFAAMDAGVPPEPDRRNAEEEKRRGEDAGARAAPSTTPDRGPRAQPSAPTTPQSEASVSVVSVSRSRQRPTREARRGGALPVSAPTSPLDGARVGRPESPEKTKRDGEEGDEKTKPTPSRASSFADGGDDRTGETALGLGAVADVAAGLPAGTGESASVAAALAVTTRWLEGVKDELSSGGEDGGDGDAAIAPGAAARMDAVAAALDSNEQWLAGALEAKARDLEAPDTEEPPDV